LVLAALENRGFTSQLSQLGGLAKSMPSLAACALVLAMASLGCPGLASFPAELSMLMGIYRNSPALALLSSLGVVLAGWYGLRMFQGTFNGEHRQGPQHSDLIEDEWVALLPLVVLCFALGLFPDFSLLQWTRGL
jgi:NADH-quinone oxidoreductase subunit M